MWDNSKGDIIEQAYKEFFGSIADTTKEAKKLDKSITLADVKAWFNNKICKNNLAAAKLIYCKSGL